MYLGAVAEVEPDRLHDLEGGAFGEHVGGGDHAGVLLDHGRGGGGGDLVQVALDGGPSIVTVFDEVAGGIHAVDRLPGLLGDVGHVLLMQRDVVAGAEPAV